MHDIDEIIKAMTKPQQPSVMSLCLARQQHEDKVVWMRAEARRIIAESVVSVSDFADQPVPKYFHLEDDFIPAEPKPNVEVDPPYATGGVEYWIKKAEESIPEIDAAAKEVITEMANRKYLKDLTSYGRALPMSATAAMQLQEAAEKRIRERMQIARFSTRQSFEVSEEQIRAIFGDLPCEPET